MRTPRLLASALLATAACGLLGGCIVVPAGRHGGHASGGEGGEVVWVPPPAPVVEVVGLAPAPGLFWIGGFWNWAGSRHVWVPGRWERQRPGYAWQPHSWQREGRGWRPAPGYWSRR